MLNKTLDIRVPLSSSSNFSSPREMRWFVTKALVSSSSLYSSRLLSVSLATVLRSSGVRRWHVSPLQRKLEEKKSCLKAHKAMKGPSKITRRLKEPDISSNEDHQSHILWWTEKMQRCRKLSAVQLIKRLVYSNLLGLDDSLKNGSLKEGTLNFEILQFKARFPREVLLCRVGDFYEAIGFDACVLVEHAGLNPFGGLRSDSIPKAGCPVVNLRQTLDDLTRSGFSVCIVEEVLGPAQARSRKGRFISGHAHPGSPYVFGLAGLDDDVDFPEPMPVVGISRSAKGYCMISVLETMKTFSEEDGLTEDAVVAKLRTCQYHHLFLHNSLRHSSSGTCRWGEFGDGGLLWGECNGKSFEWFDGNPMEEIFCKVREIYGLPLDAKFRNVTILSENRPLPLYLGTASQIGVVQTEGIPSLLKVVLPSNCFGLPSLYVRNLLLNPPPLSVALAIQEICRRMAALLQPLPEFTCISAPKLVKLLEAKEANHVEFCRIKHLVDEIVQLYDNKELNPILQALLEPTWLATGLKIDPEMLVEECRLISCRIGEMIFLHGEPDQLPSYFELIPTDFFDDMESSWKGRVKRIHAEEVFEKVERAAVALFNAVMEDFGPILLRIKSVMSPLGGLKGEISYAREHGAVWFKGRRLVPAVWANTVGEEQIKQLRPATDSKGRKVGDEWYTTVKVEDALTRYLEATSNAKMKVLDILRGLSAELQSSINVLVFSSTLIVIAKALFAHVSEGRRRKWSFPEIIELHETKGSSSPEVSKSLDLIGLSPYWFDAAKGSAVLNNITMQSLFLLTGPNGGGKSSLLRSICAAALLGICGLMVPVESAVVPHFDAIMLHMKSYDSPADGKSSFQIEMSEIHSILTVASPRSLVLLDEICRGTETAKGTCIAGSIIEKLDRVGCLGIISTHLHGIFDLPLITKNTIYKAMGVEIIDGFVKPTWKFTDGICRESLAFQTAMKEGIPEEIIKRAEKLYITMDLAHIHSRRDGARSEQVIPVSQLVSDGSRLGRTCADLSPSSTNMFNSPKVLQEQVETAVVEVCQEKFHDLYKKKCISEMPRISCISIGTREQPPPSTIGTSSVYVLFRPDNKLYVGQSDDLIGRVQAHRSKQGMQNATFLYLTVPGKSIAMQLETLLINQLPLKNFKIANKADGKHRNFGTSSVSDISDDSFEKAGHAVPEQLTAVVDSFVV